MSETITKGNARGSGYDRNADDWYQETPACIDALLKAEKFTGTIWDPACGGGNIPERCKAFGYRAAGSDLRDRGYGVTGEDFLESGGVADNIVTNPPFNLVIPFVEHALKLARRKVAIVARLALLEGQKRREFFQSTPLARIWVHSSRISMPPGGMDVPATNGSVAYAWFVWERGYVGEPRVGWLP